MSLMVTKKVMMGMTKKSEEKWYRVIRTDVSYANVKATSPEEALELANEQPMMWDICIGENEVELDEES